MTTYEIFQKRFCEAFEECGMTMEEFAEQADIPYPKLLTYFEGTMPKARHLIKLACTLKVSADYLLGLSNEK